MESRSHCFDTLGDEMLAYIFEKVLWNPLAFGAPHKGRERVWLGSVCKRFQRLVHASGSLDWQFSKPEDGNAFLCYMLRQQNNSRLLTRVAPDIEASSTMQLVAVLQSVIYPAQNSLEEIHLFVGHLVLEDAVSWEYIFRLLAAVARLRILDITLWGKEPRRRSLVALSRSWFPRPFRSLQSLTLYGFAIPSEDFGSFLARFPVLKTLELHAYVGETYALEGSLLEKAFWWGNGKAGIDVVDPANVGLPRSLEKVVALLGSESLVVSQKAAATLVNLSDNAAARRAIAAIPGTLHSLVELLDSGVHTPAAALEKLAQELANKSRIASVPGCLQKLLFLLEQYDPLEHEIAARTLVSLAKDAQIREKLVGDTEMVIRLANILCRGYGRARALSGWVLWCLASACAETASATSEVQLCLQRLVALLDEVDLSQHFEKLLCALSNDEEIRRSVTSTPGFLASLLSLVTNERVELQVAAVKSLGVLAMDVESRRLIVLVPTWLRTLIGCVESGGRDVAEKAVSVLYMLATSDAEVRRAVATDIGALQVLVSSLTSEGSPLQQPIVRLLAALARDATTRQPVAKAPGCLQGLTAVLKDGSASVQKNALEALWSVGSDDGLCKELRSVPDLVPALVDMLDDRRPLSVILAAAGALQSIAGFPETGKQIVSMPGCLQRLVVLLKCAAAHVCNLAAQVFSRLAADAGLRKEVAEEPGAVEQLVTLLGRVGPGGAHEPAARALHSLAWDLECRPPIRAAPGCLEKLFRLFKGPGEHVQSAAGEALWCTAIRCGGKDGFWERPGVLQELVGLLGDECSGVQRALSARILHNLTSDEEGQVDSEKTRAIAGEPGCLERLFGLLSSDEDSVVKWGLNALRALSADREVRTVVFGEPGFCRRSSASSTRTHPASRSRTLLRTVCTSS